MDQRSVTHASLPGDNRALEPPDSIPNSAVKRCIADGSVGSPHVRVGHRQASKQKSQYLIVLGFFLLQKKLPVGRSNRSTASRQEQSDE